MNFRTLPLLLAMLAAPACAEPTAANAPATIALASWNLEHLAETNGSGCRPRSDADYNKLRSFAASLEADVVALQEVESKAAVERIFPASEWQIVMSPRASSESYPCRESKQMSTQQRVAIAVRNGIAFDYDPARNLSQLGLGRDGLRYGVSLRLTGTQPATEVLALHLKSGCFVNDYSISDKEACTVLSQQAPILDQWIEDRLGQKTPFVLMGDFNHRLLAPHNLLWQKLATVDNKPAALFDVMYAQRSCHPRYPDLIDHILVGGTAIAGYQSFSAKVHNFSGSESEMLSDHCPISAKLVPQNYSADNVAPKSASSAVSWTRQSVEYTLLTQALYQNAIDKALPTFSKTKKPWVVFMDVDETLLDNSAYNLERERMGLSYSSDSWAVWVATRQAGAVPGAKDFVSAVLAAGGQLALITNRNRDQDGDTWANLLAEGFPITKANTCILGRTAADKAAVGSDELVNDKDLRRQQVLSGKAQDCWKGDSQLQAQWQRPLSLRMEVGDNIQDFTGLRQDSVDPQQLVSKQGRELLLLPNAMYGSWQ